MQTAPSALWSNITTARSLFFEKGMDPAGIIPEPILRSWKRCVEAGVKETRPVAFHVVEAYDLRARQEKNYSLMSAARNALHPLRGFFADTGFAAALTDLDGVLLARFGSIERRGDQLQRSLRLGANLSEAAIGTAAMNCALASEGPVRTFGAEHFYSSNEIFYCAAAPVFDIDGALIGVLDLSTDRVLRDQGVVDFVAACAHEIERCMLSRVRCAHTIVLNRSLEDSVGSNSAILKLDRDGLIVGMTRSARRLLGLTTQNANLQSFADVVATNFSGAIEDLTRTSGAVRLKLPSGVPLTAKPISDAEVGLSHSQPLSSSSFRPNETPIDMGDPSLAHHANVARRALDQGLVVLIEGETGAGKEVMARELHRVSERGEGSFVVANCGGMSELQIESELFGHEEAVFAEPPRRGTIGLLEQADGGTLFLDAIDDMPLTLQSRLLRFLDTKVFMRIGGGAPRNVGCNVLCAAQQDLKAATERGSFRADLYYRISGFTLRLKPLRERPELRQFLMQLAQTVDDDIRDIDSDALTMLATHCWPGNTREALNVLRRAALVRPRGESVRLEHLLNFLPATAVAPAADRSSGIDAPPASCATALPETLCMEEMEASTLIRALEATQGNASKAAHLLGLSRSTLQRRLRDSPSLRQIACKLRREL